MRGSEVGVAAVVAGWGWVGRGEEGEKWLEEEWVRVGGVDVERVKRVSEGLMVMGRKEGELMMSTNDSEDEQEDDDDEGEGEGERSGGDGLLNDGSLDKTDTEEVEGSGRKRRRLVYQQ